MLSEREILLLRPAGGVVGPISLIAAYFSLILGRPVTTAEAWDAVDRLNKRAIIGASHMPNGAATETG